MAVVLREHEVFQDERKDRGKAGVSRNNVVLLPVEMQPQLGKAENQASRLDFPYDDLYLLYDHIVKEVGIKDIFSFRK